MKNQFKNNPLTINELISWKSNPLINPKTGNKIKENGKTYLLIEQAYKKNKQQIEQIIESKKWIDPGVNLIDCHDDRDPISMNLFWVDENNQRKMVYPTENLAELVMYKDTKNLLRCFEKDTLRYLKTYNINIHPISMEPIPDELFESIETIDIEEIRENKSIESMALDIFQNFNKISIFIDYLWFMELDKTNLIRFNYELRDFWKQNFSSEQRSEINNQTILEKVNNDLESMSLENIQKYLLSQIELLLECNREEYKYMINYIIIGALGIVIPKIKELYPDFLFSF